MLPCGFRPSGQHRRDRSADTARSASASAPAAGTARRRSSGPAPGVARPPPPPTAVAQAPSAPNHFRSLVLLPFTLLVSTQSTWPLLVPHAWPLVPPAP